MWLNPLIIVSENFEYDIYENSVPILPMLEIDTTTVGDIITTVPCNANTKLDEIASRGNIYGEGMEAESYKIFNENIVNIVEYNFDLSKLKSLRIPV